MNGAIPWIQLGFSAFTFLAVAVILPLVRSICRAREKEVAHIDDSIKALHVCIDDLRSMVTQHLRDHLLLKAQDP